MLVIGFVGINQIISIRNTNEEQLDLQFKERVKAIGEQYTDSVNRYFEARADVINSMAVNPYFLSQLSIPDLSTNSSLLLDFSSNTAQYFDSFLNGSSYYYGFIILNASGRVLVSRTTSNVASPIVGCDFSKKPYFTHSSSDIDVTYFIDTRFDEVLLAYTAVISKALVVEDSAIGIVVSYLNINNFWNSLAFKHNVDGILDSDNEQYVARGLGLTGEMYLVNASNMKAVSPQRFVSSQQFLFTEIVDTVGVQKALENGMFIGYYDNYQENPTPVLGWTYYFGKEVSGVDHRLSDNSQARSSFGLDWIFVIEIEQEEIQSPLQTLRTAAANSMVISAGIILLSIVAIIIIVVISANYLVLPIISLTKISKSIAERDLRVDVNLKESKRNDEIGELASSYFIAINSLKENIQTIQGASDKVISFNETMVSTINEISLLSTEITINVQQISQGAANQSVYATESISELAKMSDSVDIIVNEMNKVLSVIDDIADQTNILALQCSD